MCENLDERIVKQRLSVLEYGYALAAWYCSKGWVSVMGGVKK